MRPCVKIESLEHAHLVNEMLAEEFGVSALPRQSIERIWRQNGYLENFYLTMLGRSVKWGHWPIGEDPDDRYWYEITMTLDNV